MGAGFRFACETGSGGVLILKDVMKREDILAGPHLKDYVVTYHESWYAFASFKGIDLGGQDLMLVTGQDTTSSWAVAAFTQKKKECAIEFHVGYGGAAAHIALAGSWANINSVEHRSGPKLDHPSAGPTPGSLLIADAVAQPSSQSGEGVHSPRQSVFLRGIHFRMRRFGVAFKMKAAAEPRDDDVDSNEDDRDLICPSSGSSLDGGCSLASSMTDQDQQSDLDEEDSVYESSFMPFIFLSPHKSLQKTSPKRSSRLHYGCKLS